MDTRSAIRESCEHPHTEVEKHGTRTPLLAVLVDELLLVPVHVAKELRRHGRLQDADIFVSEGEVDYRHTRV